eukprot:g7671.t1
MTSKYQDEVAAQLAKDEALEHLHALGPAMGAQSRRPVIIRARPLADGGIAAGVKVVHFIRHGEGVHNATAAKAKAEGRPCDCESNPNPGERTCPYLAPELLDARLTRVGRCQAAAHQPVTRAMPPALAPELVVVSPMNRATETALLAFPHLWMRGEPAVVDAAARALLEAGTPPARYGEGAGTCAARVPFIAVPACREQCGQHVCDRMQPRAAQEQLYPAVDHAMVEAEDTLWAPEREPKQSLSDRGYDFMLWLRGRQESRVAVATHSAWLFALFHTVLSVAEEDAALSDWFATGEMRTVEIVFEDRA